MQWPAICPKCDGKHIAIEMRDWFRDDPLPPREGYGTWWVCTDCGYAWEAEAEGIYDNV